MAALALKPGMTADQRKACFLSMVEPRRFPVCFQVAGLTARTKLATMDIVAGMTTVTCSGWLYPVLRVSMTGVALDDAVGTTQLETGIAVMIEICLRPARLRMAVLAVRAKTAFVDIILSMTPEAGCR